MESGAILARWILEPHTRPCDLSKTSIIRSKCAGRQSLISLAVIHSPLNLDKTNYLSSGYGDYDRC
jgi:hypothetical protein